MTSAQISNFLSKININTDEWVEIKNLATITLNTDGNVLVKKTEMYKFDTATNLLFIKEYFYKKVGDGWELDEISDNLADVIVDFDNITGFIIGRPLEGNKSVLISELYGGE